MNHAHTLPSSHRDRRRLERRRLQAAKLFVKGQTQAEVARWFGVSREAIRKWHQAWKQEGKNGLKSIGAPGPKPRLEPEKLARIEAALLKGPTAFGYTTQIWTLARMAAVIKSVARVSYHPGHVWYVLQNLGWSCQKPETRAKERNEDAISYWRKVTWPRIKKKQFKLAQN